MDKKRRTVKMRIIYIFSIFLIFLVTFFLLMPVALWVAHLGIFGHTPFVQMFAILFASVITGTFLSIFVSSTVIKPVLRINKAMQEVANGNFDIQLDNPMRAEETEDIFKNFNIMVSELRSTTTLRNDFVTNVSHEFKTPLASIDAYATLLQDESASIEERHEYIKMILDASRQLGELSENILRLSKLESSNMPLQKTDFRLDEQIRRVILLMESRWEKKQINVDIELAEVTFFGNEELIMQVWINLLDNAIKYTDTNGKVSISLNSVDNEVFVKIEDNGIGMSPKLIRHVFEKFYQGNESRHEQGNGLGLALVQTIIERHDGDIELQSEEGKGTSFTIRLPLSLTKKSFN